MTKEKKNFSGRNVLFLDGLIFIYIFLSEKQWILFGHFKGNHWQYELGCSLYSESWVVSILSQSWCEKHSHYNSAFVEARLFRRRKDSNTFPRETGYLADISPDSSEVFKLFNWDCNEGLHSCDITFPSLWSDESFRQSPWDSTISTVVLTCWGRYLKFFDALVLQQAPQRQDPKEKM